MIRRVLLALSYKFSFADFKVIILKIIVCIKLQVIRHRFYSYQIIPLPSNTFSTARLAGSENNG